MDGANLVNGKKEELLAIFKTLKKVYGVKWVQRLSKFDEWHGTRAGMYAWQNASRGKVGNETLRRIITDMQTIIANENKKPVSKRLGFSKPKSIHS